MYINFKTTQYRGCIDLETNDLYLSHVSPKVHRVLGCKHITYDKNDLSIEREIHEAVKELQ